MPWRVEKEREGSRTIIEVILCLHVLHNKMVIYDGGCLGFVSLWARFRGNLSTTVKTEGCGFRFSSLKIKMCEENFAK